MDNVSQKLVQTPKMTKMTIDHAPEPVFFNVYGAQESILRNEFRQPM
jgi:hypothetical protein